MLRIEDAVNQAFAFVLQAASSHHERKNNIVRKSGVRGLR
jgi:hypothetical protein